MSFMTNNMWTPCIGICSTGIGDAVCRGCKRFAHEIIDWNRYTLEQRQAIMNRLQDMLRQVVNSKIEITDKERLLAHIEHQQIDHHKAQSPQALVYSLLRFGANQIKDPLDFGFSIKAKYKNQPLSSLKQQIDNDFYTLSCAYYERFIEPKRSTTAKQIDCL